MRGIIARCSSDKAKLEKKIVHKAKKGKKEESSEYLVPIVEDAAAAIVIYL